MTAAQLRAWTIKVPAPAEVKVMVAGRQVRIGHAEVIDGILYLVAEAQPEPPGLTISPVSGSGY